LRAAMASEEAGSPAKGGFGSASMQSVRRWARWIARCCCCAALGDAHRRACQCNDCCGMRHRRACCQLQTQSIGHMLRRCDGSAAPAGGHCLRISARRMWDDVTLCPPCSFLKGRSLPGTVRLSRTDKAAPRDGSGSGAAQPPQVPRPPSRTSDGAPAAAASTAQPDGAHVGAQPALHHWTSPVRSLLN
jgi:hypothetical protein